MVTLEIRTVRFNDSLKFHLLLRFKLVDCGPLGQNELNIRRGHGKTGIKSETEHLAKKEGIPLAPKRITFLEQLRMSQDIS